MRGRRQLSRLMIYMYIYTVQYTGNTAAGRQSGTVQCTEDWVSCVRQLWELIPCTVGLQWAAHMTEHRSVCSEWPVSTNMIRCDVDPDPGGKNPLRNIIKYATARIWPGLIIFCLVHGFFKWVVLNIYFLRHYLWVCILYQSDPQNGRSLASGSVYEWSQCGSG